MDTVDDQSICKLYSEAETVVHMNKHYLYLLFIEACKTLWLNHTLIVFDTVYTEFREWWTVSTFQDLEQTKDKAENCFVMEYLSAAMKLCALEERLTE